VVTGEERRVSRIRGWIFTGTVIVVAITVFSVTAVIVAYRMKDYLVIYHNMDTTSYWPLKFLVLCLIALLSLSFELILGINYLIDGLVDVTTIYLSILTMKLWLNQIWFGILLFNILGVLYGIYL